MGWLIIGYHDSWKWWTVNPCHGHFRFEGPRFFSQISANDYYHSKCRRHTSPKQLTIILIINSYVRDRIGPPSSVGPINGMHQFKRWCGKHPVKDMVFPLEQCRKPWFAHEHTRAKRSFSWCISRACSSSFDSQLKTHLPFQALQVIISFPSFFFTLAMALHEIPDKFLGSVTPR